MVSFVDFSSAIRSYNKAAIDYYVFGGLALDGIRGTLSREHSDLDLYVKAWDVEKFLDIHPDAVQKDKMFYAKSGNLDIGVIVLTQSEGCVVANGKKETVYYPQEIFSANMMGLLGRTVFRVAPPEALVYEAQFSDHADDKKFAAMLQYNQSLLGKIRGERNRL